MGLSGPKDPGGPYPVGKAVLLALVTVHRKARVHLDTRRTLQIIRVQLGTRGIKKKIVIGNNTKGQSTFTYKMYSIQNVLAWIIIQVRIYSNTRCIFYRVHSDTDGFMSYTIYTITQDINVGIFGEYPQEHQ